MQVQYHACLVGVVVADMWRREVEVGADLKTEVKGASVVRFLSLRPKVVRGMWDADIS
jgi:hypothetical protein